MANKLNQLIPARRVFNPLSSEDVGEFRHFFVHDRWAAGCPFILEHPYTNVPEMIKDVLLQHVLGTQRGSQHRERYIRHERS